MATLIPLRAKYRYRTMGKFKCHYDHQPGVTFKDEQGILHVIPDKKDGRIGKKGRGGGSRTATTRIGDLRR
jgi:hypothetical protein